MRRNQENAQKKVYHHDMGSGGYDTAIPKWQKMEADIIAKGIEPELAKCPHAQRIGFLVMGEDSTHRPVWQCMGKNSKQQHTDWLLL